MKNPLDSIGFTLTLGVALAIVIMVLPLTPGGDFSHLSLGRWGHIVAGVFGTRWASAGTQLTTPPGQERSTGTWQR